MRMAFLIAMSSDSHSHLKTYIRASMDSTVVISVARPIASISSHPSHFVPLMIKLDALSLILAMHATRDF